MSLDCRKAVRAGWCAVVLLIVLGLAGAPGRLHGADGSPVRPRGDAIEGKSRSADQASGSAGPYTLNEIIGYALKYNPRMRIAGRNIETETYGVESAKADRMPRLDLGGGMTRYRYEMPLTPLVITLPLSNIEIPEFKQTIWDTSVSFKLPLFRGGRLMRAVTVAETKKAVAEDMFRVTRQDLIYNLSSVYYKIAQLEKLLAANDASVRQLEAHKKNVNHFLEAGTAPRLDLLKTDVELAHAVENRLVVKNNLASAYELLKTLMGMDDMTSVIAIAPESGRDPTVCTLEESLKKGLAQRPDFKAAEKKLKVSEERVKIALGKRFPDIYAQGQYGGQAGNEFAFKENWYVGVRFSVPVFDGGLISSEINRERTEMEKAKEEERGLRHSITREVRDGHLTLDNARERIQVTEKALTSARENLRVELLKYETGAGTSTDVIDARTAALRAETDYYQALFDRETAVAYLRKATGDDGYEGEVGK